MPSTWKVLVEARVSAWSVRCSELIGPAADWLCVCTVLAETCVVPSARRDVTPSAHPFIDIPMCRPRPACALLFFDKASLNRLPHPQRVA
eukprot:gene25162-biopygen22476